MRNQEKNRKKKTNHKENEIYTDNNSIKKIVSIIIILIGVLLGYNVSDGTLNTMLTGFGLNEPDPVLSDQVEDETWFEKLPDYNGTVIYEINHNQPFFTKDEKHNKTAFENYSELDSLGRCGVAYANICEELMPTEERGNISRIHPSGWKKNMGWERCHLIGFQLAGENANKKNLVTGTREFNVKGMLPYENTVASYINDNPMNHVLYRVTPKYREEDDLIPYGVLMEAWSVEDNGYEVSFCVFVYNATYGKTINYKTGVVKNAKNKRKKY